MYKVNLEESVHIQFLNKVFFLFKFQEASL